MADLIITAASVLAGAGANVKHGTAGAAITAGQVVYREAATATYKLADNDAATALHSAVGIALHASLSGQPLAVLSDGPITIGAALTAGTAYYLSSTPGAICPAADLGIGDEPVLIGLATSASVLSVAIRETNVTL